MEKLPRSCFLVMKAVAVKMRVMTRMTAHQRTVVATHLIRAAAARRVRKAAVVAAAAAAATAPKIQIQMMNQKEREKRDNEVFDKRGCFQLLKLLSCSKHKLVPAHVQAKSSPRDHLCC